MDTIAACNEKIAGLIAQLKQEVAIETNEGTYGAEEACRKTGSGDPAHNNYTIFESLNGSRRVRGCDPDKAPGYPRKLSVKSAAERRKEIARLEGIAKRLASHKSWEPMPHDAMELLSR